LISWGENRSIRLHQLSASLDEELDPIRDEIEAIKTAITAIESSLIPPMCPVCNRSTVTLCLLNNKRWRDGVWKKRCPQVSICGGVSSG
jgi:hypothetical protein